MKIAIPIFHTKVSPRFDETQEFVLLETQNTEIIASKRLPTQGWPVMEKMKQLVGLGVDTLICGGIDRTSWRYLSENGINICSWVTGEVDDAVICFLEKRMKPGIILGDRGNSLGRWQFCKRRDHLCNRFGSDLNIAEKEVKTMPRRDGTGPKGQGPRSGKASGSCQRGKKGGGNRQRCKPESGRGSGVATKDSPDKDTQ